MQSLSFHRTLPFVNSHSIPFRGAKCAVSTTLANSRRQPHSGKQNAANEQARTPRALNFVYTLVYTLCGDA